MEDLGAVRTQSSSLATAKPRLFTWVGELRARIRENALLARETALIEGCRTPTRRALLR